MNELSEAALRQRHHRLYAAAGCELAWFLPRGWLGIVDEVCTALEQRCDDAQLAAIATNLSAKEKFGALRFEGYSPPEIRVWFEDLIATAESRSQTTCQDCGADGATLRHGAWQHTTCDACEGKRRTPHVGQ